jgi:methionyl-tRNA synthetase
VLIRELDPETFVHAYNVDLQVLYPWDGVVEPPFGAAWAVLAAGESTKPHAHQECETFFVARGRGVFAIDGEQVEVGPGSVTFHEPFHHHVLTNTSDDEDLLFLTVWWEDKGRWSAGGAAGAHRHEHDGDGHDAHDHVHHPRAAAPAPAAGAAAEPAVRLERELVTAAPPTPNGDLHLGHLAGPYLSGDVYARAQRLRGVDAHFVFGSDDNSIYVKTCGEGLDLAPQPTATRFTDAIEETLAMAGVATTAFPRPNASPYHRELTRDFFRTLHERGALEEREEPAPWCGPCGRFLFEAYVRGRCPHCGDGVLGQTCESCGRVHDARDVVDAVCSRCGAAPETRPLRRLVFPLSRHAGFLRDYYRRVAMNHHLRALVEGVLADGPPDVAVTHPTDWGIEVPLAGWADQRLYVWLEMAPRYLAYARHVGDETGAGGGWERFWKAPEARVVQFFGYDNSFYYAMLLPAMFHAFDPELRLPAAFVTNEFYRLDGAKFSTTRDHRILGRDLLAEAPRDAVRFYLMWSAPEREETNFTREEFRATVRRELHDGAAAWLGALGRRLAGGFGGAVPATGDWTGEHRRFYHRLEELLADAGEAYAAEGFSPQRATRVLGELVREARRFAAGERHWDGVESRGEERRTGIALEALAAKLLGLLAAPVMPDFAARLWRALGYPEGPARGAWNTALDWLPGGQPADFGEPLLPGLDEYLAG